VSIKIGAIDEDVIKENKYELPQVRAKNVVHPGLKSGRGISEPKGHDSKFIKALKCYEGCFRDIGRVHSNLVILCPEV